MISGRIESALITGGAGCLGTEIARRLGDRGIPVRVLDQRAEGENSRGAPEYFRGDISDADTVRRAARGVDVVFNLAALQPVSRAGHNFHRVNAGGTENVLQAAIAEGCGHVVHLSSSIVYGVPNGRPFREADTPRPIGAYGASKLAAEERCAAARRHGLTVTVVRPRLIMGPGRLGLFSILFRWIRESRRIYLIGSGENRFQMTNTADLAEACIAAAKLRVDGTLNIGSDNVPRVREALSALVHHAGSGSRLVPLPARLARVALFALDRLALAPLTLEHYLFADKDFVLDTTRAKETLGWRPVAGDAEALCAAYDSFCRGSARADGFEHDRPSPGVLEVLRRWS